MKGSMTRRIACMIISLVAGTVILCWIVNTVLLKSFYVQNKLDSLQHAYVLAAAAAQEGTIYSGDNSDEWMKLCAEKNLTMMIMDSSIQSLFFVGYDKDNYLQQFMEVLFATKDGNTQVLKEAEAYSIGQYRDSRMGTDYLILWGNLEDGNMILMRTPMESIQESVQIANRFLAYVGILAIIFSAVISYFVTRRITTPILQIADLSRRMSNLDFEAKYHGTGHTELDDLGQHMNQLSENLERAISELKSANNQLMMDIEKKEQLDEMRKEFLSNVSHELKTPLALIQGYAEGLQECIDEDPQSREFYCEVIVDEADKMNRMVKQLLTLNQLESGNDTVTMERFDLTELIVGVIQATAILREENGSHVIFGWQEPFYVWADEFKTEEVLTNFITNAIHHVRGEKKIIISLAPGQEVVRVSVFNTGEQIPDQDLEQIWTKFYKVDKARTRAYGGSGIGLSIVKAIMDSFHRSCGVINHPDGVEFWFELDCQ